MFNDVIHLDLYVFLFQVPDPALIVDCGQTDPPSEDVPQQQSPVREDLSKVIYVLNRSPQMSSDSVATGLEQETDDGIEKVRASQYFQVLRSQMIIV